MKHFRATWYRVRLWWCTIFGRSYKAAVCGHYTKKVVLVTVFEKKIIFVLDTRHITYCQRCLAVMSIRCAWCKEPICVNDPITLYHAAKDFKIPEGAVTFKEHPLQLVGCLRLMCADTCAERMGFWVVPGKVERVFSPLEMAMATGEVIVCNNISDYHQAIRVPEHKNGR